VSTNAKAAKLDIREKNIANRKSSGTSNKIVGEKNGFKGRAGFEGKKDGFLNKNVQKG